jgi:RimJ/RimL family protein N-acetyltransferase
MLSLTTARLQISPLRVKDLDAFVEYRQDPQIARYQSWEPSFSKEQGIGLIQSQAGVSFPEKGDWLQLALHRLETDELIGDLALHSLEGGETAFEIGFTIAKKHQGQGYAKEGAKKLVEFLFDEHSANRIIATPDSRNLPSIKLLEALGFVKLPEKSWTEDFKGENVTVDFYELKAPEASR